MRRIRLVLASVVAVVALLGAPAAPAEARAVGCAAGEVTVVVDFGPLGGGTAVRCVRSPSSGLDALSKAGFGYGFRPNFPGMVCTINARPDPCNGAPADAYWAYWHGPAGGSWTYATQGAGSRTPSAGSVEGWAFGDDRQPSIPPPAATPTATTAPPTTAPKPTPTAPTAASPAPPATPPARAPGPVGPEAPEPTPTPDAPTTTTAASPDTGADPPTETSPGSSAVSIDAAGSPAEREAAQVTELSADPAAAASGQSVSGLFGIAVLAAVAGAGAWEFRRRRTP
jgi:hypothetical protein